MTTHSPVLSSFYGFDLNPYDGRATTRFMPSKNLSSVVHVRFTRTERDQLDRMAAARGVTVSSLVRSFVSLGLEAPPSSPEGGASSSWWRRFL